SFRRPSWSDDGKTVFVGVAKWDEQPAGDKDKKDDKAKADDDEEAASVDVWHARDIFVIPRQKLTARTDRQRNMLAAWHLDDGTFVQLGKSSTEQVVPLKRQPIGYVADWTNYAMDRTIGRPAADISLVDLKT